MRIMIMTQELRRISTQVAWIEADSPEDLILEVERMPGIEPYVVIRPRHLSKAAQKEQKCDSPT